MKKVGVKVLRRDEWQIERDLVLKKEGFFPLAVRRNRNVRVSKLQADNVKERSKKIF